MSTIQCSVCNATLPDYSRFCKHCGAVINSPATNAIQYRKIPVTRSFKTGSSGNVDMPTHHIPAAAEQAWGQLGRMDHTPYKERERTYTLAPTDPGRETRPGARRQDPETERLPTTRNTIRPLTRTRLTPQGKPPLEENSPIITPEQLPKAPAPQPLQPTQNIGARPHPVQLRKIQAQSQEPQTAPTGQHPLMLTEQSAPQNLENQLTLQNMMGVSPSTPRLQVQSMHPAELMRHEPFSFPISLCISPLNTVAKRMLILESIVAILLLTVIIGALILALAYALSPQPPSPSKPALTLIGPTLPGSAVTLHGSRFLPESKVKFSIDNVMLAQTQAAPDETIVKSNGTFDKTFTIPRNWKPGSSHSIQAYVQNHQTALSVRLDFVVQQPATLPTYIFFLTDEV